MYALACGGIGPEQSNVRIVVGGIGPEPANVRIVVGGIGPEQGNVRIVVGGIGLEQGNVRIVPDFKKVGLTTPRRRPIVLLAGYKPEQFGLS